jgi:hypothetical protein
MYDAVEQQYRLPSGFLARTATIESGGNPNAKNASSSAAGLFQFTDGTAKAYGLTNKYDAAASTLAAARLASDNAAILARALGRPPTAAELYLAHQQGGGGAVKLLSNPSALAVNVVGDDAVRLNGGRSDMTAGEFAGLWLSKYDGSKPSAPPPDASYTSLAYAYANGKMSPEDMALYEQGMMAGDFPAVAKKEPTKEEKKKEDKPNALDALAAFFVPGQRRPVAPPPDLSFTGNSGPLSRFSGI